MVDIEKKDELPPEYYKDISRMVESGEIFNDAREWYLRTYILTVVERSWLIVLAIAMAFMIGTAYHYYKTLLPIVTGYPVLINIKDSSEQVSRMNYLGNSTKDFDVNKIYTNLLTEVFIKSFESYNWKRDFRTDAAGTLTNINSKKIEFLADQKIQEEFNERMSIRKINSYILKYRKNTVRNITVDKNSFTAVAGDLNNEGKRKYTVSGRFRADEISAGSTVSSNWEFKIILYFQEIEYNFESKEFNDVYYKVFNYETKKLDQ